MAGLRILGDVGADEPYLAVPHLGMGLLQARLARAQGLHLRAHEREPGLEALEELVLMPGTTVLRDRLCPGTPRHARILGWPAARPMTSKPRAGRGFDKRIRRVGG